ncbi:MAG: hypothetical protein MZU84_04615 [Sphingobacterium sp.]|nr:hypothetical protein [Sphingobacterium sp.]
MPGAYGRPRHADLPGGAGRAELVLEARRRQWRRRAIDHEHQRPVPGLSVARRAGAGLRREPAHVRAQTSSSSRSRAIVGLDQSCRVRLPCRASAFPD